MVIMSTVCFIKTKLPAETINALAVVGKNTKTVAGKSDMLSVKLPIKGYEKVYWIHHSKENDLVRTEVIIDGYDIRYDADCEPFLVVLFHNSITYETFRFKYRDVRFAKSVLEADAIIRKILSNRHEYPLVKQQYKGD